MSKKTEPREGTDLSALATLTMKQLPATEQPYERAESEGVRMLSNAELLAIILTTGRGGETALQTAQKILVMTDGPKGLLDTSPEELREVPGIGPVKSVRILAAIELGQRAAADRQAEIRASASGPDDVIHHVEANMRYLPREEFHVLLLDTRNRIIKSVQISQGGLASAVIHPRDIFREAVKANAASIILVHNHPSGDSSPSNADIESTRRFSDLGKMMGIPVLDHVIVGAESSSSFSRLGLC
ncbi:MAG TPA: DNA repair protein RadC [Clostridia bacterium]|nr:DNA repair protein RadC [Clostridia bacterium]